jgi:hypothetical protein
MYIEAWYKIWCPKCEGINWICNGNESDITGMDVEACKCRKCSHIFWLGEPDEIEMEISGYKKPEDGYWEDGKEKPD